MSDSTKVVVRIESGDWIRQVEQTSEFELTTVSDIAGMAYEIAALICLARGMQ